MHWSQQVELQVQRCWRFQCPPQALGSPETGSGASASPAATAAELSGVYVTEVMSMLMACSTTQGVGLATLTSMSMVPVTL